MKCQKCDLEQDRPLETYDGRLWCVKCHAPLTGTAPAFAFTEESEAFYNLSEICFGDYLMKASQYVTLSGEPAKKEGVPTEELRELRDKAVEYCSRSAAAGDPRAVVRMGYYLDRDYAETGRSAELRCILSRGRDNAAGGLCRSSRAQEGDSAGDGRECGHPGARAVHPR